MQHTSCRAADQDTACSAAVSPPPAVVVTCAACPDSRLRPLRVSPALSILHCLHSPVSSHTNDNNHIVSPQTGGRMSFVLFEHRIREGHHHPPPRDSQVRIKFIKLSFNLSKISAIHLYIVQFAISQAVSVSVSASVARPRVSSGSTRDFLC